MKKVLSLLLALVMIVGLLPLTAMAKEEPLDDGVTKIALEMHMSERSVHEHYRDAMIALEQVIDEIRSQTK